ncbi:Two-component system response regulator [Lysobacter dokdonensis DS-58]|uniref:Two-component system response regulator n=1 Tax=Lysobacter dokdonensis DS-58 TaxID=1300345 RepID=A0A0A2WPR2_9GAMM|nr:Two-component system response regulator [Lysobacter dokdonensis DS-58]
MNLRQVEILLVEDSKADAEMTLRTLSKHGIANHVDWVRDGVQALEWLFREGEYAGRDNGDPRLVLLDIKMPRMDGLQVLERMKRDPRTQRIPVVMMTSSREEFDLLASYTLGVNSFIVKPVDFDAFASTIAQVGMYWMIANEVPD